MEKSKVYFTDLRATSDCNLLDKIEKLVIAAGIKTIDFKDKYVVIKIHFGEPGNLAYLRPNYSKRIVELIQSLGAKVFLSDCNTLYVGGRKNAIDHLESAYSNGYNPFSCGAHLIIGDGLKGTDEILIPIHQKHIKEAKIGRAIMDADIFISMNHFKGHESTGFGGALKNIGMGCGSRAGKMEMHNSSKPQISPEVCRSCGACFKMCAHNALSFDENRKAKIDLTKCVGCGRCIGACNFDAISTLWDESNDILNEKIAEYTYAVVKDRPHFHISLAIDISPCCDCHSENDLPICADVGMFASFDPVAIDVACADACNKAPIIPGSVLDEAKCTHDHDHHDHFTNTHPETNWKSCVEHAEYLGIGQQAYELIILK